MLRTSSLLSVREESVQPLASVTVNVQSAEFDHPCRGRFIESGLAISELGIGTPRERLAVLPAAFGGGSWRFLVWSGRFPTLTANLIARTVPHNRPWCLSMQAPYSYYWIGQYSVAGKQPLKGCWLLVRPNEGLDHSSGSNRWIGLSTGETRATSQFHIATPNNASLI